VALAGDRLNIYSAGTKPAKATHPLAIQVMGEVGIEIAGQKPKHLTQYLGKLPVRYLVLVCDRANKECPRIWPGMAERLFWPFDDPATVEGSDEQVLAGFRRARDEIRDAIEGWLSVDALNRP